MKKGFILPLLVVTATLNAQGATNVGATNAPTETFADTVAYTYVKDGVSYASPEAKFAVNGVDEQSGLDKIFVSVDGGEYAPYRGPISFSEEGLHTLSYRFIDKVGNISDSKLFQINIDATPVRVLDAVYAPEVYYASGRRYVGLKNEISFKYFDDLTGVAFIEYANGSNEMARYQAPFTPESLGLTNNGSFVLKYQATDMVSNVTTAKSETLYLDATAPTVNVFASKAYDVNGVKYISPKDVIEVEAFDNETKLKEVMYSINGAEYTNYDAAIGIRIKTPGEYTVKAKAVDIVGNISEEVSYVITIDATPPTGDTEYTDKTEEETTKAPMTSTETPNKSLEVPATEIAPATN